MVTSDEDADIHAELIRIEREIRRLMDDLARLRELALDDPPPSTRR